MKLNQNSAVADGREGQLLSPTIFQIKFLKVSFFAA